MKNTDMERYRKNTIDAINELLSIARGMNPNTLNKEELANLDVEINTRISNLPYYFNHIIYGKKRLTELYDTNSVVIADYFGGSK